MKLARRSLVVGLGLGLLSTASIARQKVATPATIGADTPLVPDGERDQTAVLQRLVDEAANRRTTLMVPPGRYFIRSLMLRSGSRISGANGATVLEYIGSGEPLVSGDGSDGLRLEGLTLDGAHRALDPARAGSLLAITRSSDIGLRDLAVRNSAGTGIKLDRSGGRIHGCRITHVSDAGIFSNDANGLEIAGNVVTKAANNGILVWRSTAGEDGTIVSGNRIEMIGAAAGGSGQNGNGVNVYRAGNVLVTGNRIADCAFTAIRGNAASNIQMVANNCQRLGEVALYAEFDFQGALIANNLVDNAATGISVTNFNEGGRLAVIQGNLIRNLFRREAEPIDKRGDGIAVEADAVVTGNTIENAATFGILIGWGRYMRDVSATSNLIRNAHVGIGVTGDIQAGAVMITANMISGAKDGAIRSLDLARPYGPDLAIGRSGSARVLIERNFAV